jgi:hypothetical protein
MLFLGQAAGPPEFDPEAAAAAGGLLAAMGAMLFVYAAIVLLMIVSLWKIFSKAGQPGWAAIIPIYNYVVLLEIVGRPIWWIILLLVPCVNIVILIILMVDLAKSFGKDGAFAAGLIILGLVFFPILAFGSSEYQGPAATPAA